ncbi:MAG: hypothetical protein ACRD59_05435 [Candidatus Acidiferrales bacterium]
MVFAIAALLIQFSPTPQMLAPTLAIRQPSGIATEDGTKPKPVTPASVNGASATVAADSGTGHLDLNTVKLNGDPSGKAAPGMTAVALETDQNSQSLSTVRIPVADTEKPICLYPAETPRLSRSWLALSLVQHAAAGLDAYSTRQAIGHGAVEDDPLMRPFAHSGAIYAAIQVGPVLLDYAARRMQRSEFGLVRRMWFVPQSISTAGFLFSGVHNLNVAGRH